jgi:hypothetical protein
MTTRALVWSSTLATLVAALGACGSGKSTTGTAASGSGGKGSATASSSSGSGGAGGQATSSTGGSEETGGGGGAHDGGVDASDGGRDFSTDTTLFYGASRCAQANVQLCEDFESGTLDTTTWTVNGDTPVIDGVHAARGSKALHITKSGNGESYLRETKTFPATNNTYFGRIFAYFDQIPTTAGMTYAHWTFVAASGTGVEGEIRLSGQLSNGLNHFGVGTDSGNSDGGTGDWTNSDDDPTGSPLPVPTGKWICIEWMHKGDTNETRFYWDATEHPSLYTSATLHGGNTNAYDLPDFTNVWVGWQEYQTSTEPFEMWVDEIAIDKERIGCVL